MKISLSRIITLLSAFYFQVPTSRIMHKLSYIYRQPPTILNLILLYPTSISKIFKNLPRPSTFIPVTIYDLPRPIGSFLPSSHIQPVRGLAWESSCGTGRAPPRYLSVGSKNRVRWFGGESSTFSLHFLEIN
jgi:hypothetical protein